MCVAIKDKTTWLQSDNVGTIIHSAIRITVLKIPPPHNKLLHFLLTRQFVPANSFPSPGVSLGLDVSYISLFFLRGSFWA